MSHCCLCGLLCSLHHAAPAASTSRTGSHVAHRQAPPVEDCGRRNRWLSETQQMERSTAKHATAATAGSPESRLADVAAIGTLFKTARRSLIWIDGADVNTTRSAVALAQSTCSTVHVGQSSGSAVAHRILANQGWLGSSLAEVATHADLIITLGSGLNSEAPLLTRRFLAPALARSRTEWWHIDVRNSDMSASTHDPSNTTPSPSFTAVWPRERWYEALTRILLALRDGDPRSECKSDPRSECKSTVAYEAIDSLVSKLRRAKNSVWIWDAEEFRDAIDELCISRLLSISRLLMRKARCSLLCLESQVGRVTALETLLWLTGCSGTADFDGKRWSQPPSLGDAALEDWQQAFDSILLVRNVPSVYPLPNLKASHYLVTGQCLLPNGVPPHRVTNVSSCGIGCDGHLMRGDRATISFCATSLPASSPGEPLWTPLPSAAALLDQVRDQLQSGATCNAN